MNILFSLNEISVSYSHRLRVSEQSKITCSKDVYVLVYPGWIIDVDYRESFNILLLSRSNRVIGMSNLFVWGLSGVVVNPKLVFQVALKCNAASIIAIHNHPSGNLNASDTDLKLTRKLIDAGKILDLPVLDHVIITSESYYSLADEGVLWYRSIC